MPSEAAADASPDPASAAGPRDTRLPAANRIAEFRRQRGWSQEQLAVKVGTKANTIYRLEKGRIQLTVEWMARLAEGLGCRQRDLIEDNATDREPSAHMTAGDQERTWEEQGGQRIKRARTDAGLVQKDIAKACGVTIQAVHGWEAGKSTAPANAFVKIAQLTNSDLTWLLTGEALAGHIGAPKAVANSNAADHMMMRGLMQTLPTPGVEWPVAQQALWLQTAAHILALLYKSDPKSRVTIEVSE